MKAYRKTFYTLFHFFHRLGVTSAGKAAMVGAIFFTSFSLASAADTNAVPAPASITKPADPKAAAPEAKADKKAEAIPMKKLSGVELYAMHCNRCHPERYPDELTGQQWSTIMAHMRVRANLPAAQARLVLKYLQEEGGY